MEPVFIDRLDRMIDEMKAANDAYHSAKHIAIRQYCPYSIGDKAPVQNVFNFFSGRQIIIDDIDIARDVLNDGSWCWILTGRLLSVSGSAGKKKLKSFVRVSDAQPVTEK